MKGASYPSGKLSAAVQQQMMIKTQISDGLKYRVDEYRVEYRVVVGCRLRLTSPGEDWSQCVLGCRGRHLLPKNSAPDAFGHVTSGGGGFGSRYPVVVRLAEEFSVAAWPTIIKNIISDQFFLSKKATLGAADKKGGGAGYPSQSSPALRQALVERLLRQGAVPSPGDELCHAITHRLLHL